MADQLGAKDLLTPEEMKALISQDYFVHNPDAFENLASPEVDLFNSINHQRFSGKDGQSHRLDSNVASGVPLLGNVGPEDVLMLGQLLKSGAGTAVNALRGFANSGEGFWGGVKGSINALLPAEVERAAVSAGGEAASQVPSNITRLRPGSGASADQVGEHVSTQVNDLNALGLRRPSVSRLSPSASGESPSLTGGVRLRSPNGNGRFGEMPFGLQIDDPKLFKELQALEAELAQDPNALAKTRALLQQRLGGNGGPR